MKRINEKTLESLEIKMHGLSKKKINKKKDILMYKKSISRKKNAG